MTKTVPPKSSPPADWQTGQPSEPFELKPPLARALDSLVVSLDEELVRYRYARRGQGVVPPPRRTAFRQRRKALDLIDVKATTSSAKGADQAEEATVSANAGAATLAGGVPTTSELPPPPPPNPQLSGSLAAGGETAQGAMPMPPLQPTGGAIAPYTAIPEDYLETTEALLRSEYEGYDDESQEPEYEPSLLNRLSTPLGVGALLLVLVGSGGLGYLVANPKAVNHLWNHPAMQAMRGKSGENMMAGVDDADVPGVDGLSPNLAADEFSDLDLSTLSTLPNQNSRPTPGAFNDLNENGITPPGGTASGADAAKAPQPGTASGNESGSAAAASPTTTPQIAINRPTVAVPTPAANRPAASRPATPAQPAASAAPRVTAPAAPAANPQASRAPQAAAAPATTPAAPSTPQALPPVQAAVQAPAPLQAATTPTAPSANPNYYVVTSYTGDQSLANVRNVVGDAYVRNFPTGARIQMGAFQQESSAREMVQQLENSGISAEVYEMK